MAASANVGIALTLTLLAGLSTGIGSAIAYFIKHPKVIYLSFSLGLSAGVMIYVSFMELLPQAVQTPGAPALAIAPASPGFALISWTPATGTNWVLQETLSLTGSWTNSPSGWTNPVTVSATAPATFYRLFKP